jgi:hypothetical protein
MSSPFDHLRDNVFFTAQRTFGYAASWVSLDEIKTWEGIVLIKQPAADYLLAGMELDPQRVYMEYLRGQFDGLAERVKSRATIELEVVTVAGIRYNATSILEVRDGDTLRVTLVPEQTQTHINRAL